MNLVPVVDVVFLLLVFFLLGTTFVLQPGIQVRMPVSPFLLGPVANPKIISITAPPHSRIYFENREVGLEQIPSLLEGLGETASILIKADYNTSYDLIMKVSSACLEAGHTVVLATASERTVEMPVQQGGDPEEADGNRAARAGENGR